MIRKVLVRKAAKDAALEVIRAAPAPPPPRGKDVLVRVNACAVAYRDVLDRQGAFPFIKEDAVLGHEFSGVVTAAGPNVDTLAVGDRVVSLHWDQDEAWPSPLTRSGPVKSFLGITLDGGYSDFCTAPQGALVKVPRDLDITPIQAAPVMSTFGTVWQGAVTRGGLKKGDSVLVTGASGGVGSAAVLLAKELGCTVFASTSNPGKANYLETLGADEVIVGDKANRNERIVAMGGVDMAIDCVGEPTFLQSVRSLRPEGTAVIVGNVSNGIGKLPLGITILNSLRIVGSDSIEAQALQHLFLFLGTTGLRPHIAATLPLEQAAEGHRMVEEMCVEGRVVLDVSGPDGEWDR
jgi:acryloyl-coenzyme A reductase